tara:strand:+ start:349 stop:567 length:219 start_codon:yes stop_codon:yes gene_type:complete
VFQRLAAAEQTTKVLVVTLVARVLVVILTRLAGLDAPRTGKETLAVTAAAAVWELYLETVMTECPRTKIRCS